MNKGTEGITIWPVSHFDMNPTVIVAIVSAAGTIFAAAFTFYLTKRHELAVQLRKEKLNHYKVLLAAVSDLAVDGTNKEDANMRFALAANTIGLAAPQYVINALMAFHDEIKISNAHKSQARHDKLLNDLLLAIRQDIGLAKGDDAATFNFHLIGSAPQSRSQNLDPVKGIEAAISPCPTHRFAYSIESDERTGNH
jgi:hypothetical protein